MLIRQPALCLHGLKEVKNEKPMMSVRQRDLNVPGSLDGAIYCLVDLPFRR
jgi:hypothetical protein